MTYRIAGLDHADFAELFAMDEAALAARGARRVTASADRGFPCRVRLANAQAGEELILLNHVSHDVPTPFRHAYAIYVGEAQAPEPYIDELPPVFTGRPLGLRGFSVDGMLLDAQLALPGQADDAIRQLLADRRIAYIDAHNAAHGCFLARITRDDELVR